RSMRSIPCSSRVFRCSALSRRASRPPCILGCSVLTRPSRISGEPVCWATSVTARPASASSLAVPPVDSKRTPRCAKAWAKSTMPVLSETEIKAVWIFMVEMSRVSESGLQLVRQQLLAQGAARNAQHFGRLRLVAIGLFQGHLQDGPLDAANDHGQHIARLGFAQIIQVAFELIAHGLFKWVGFTHDPW